MLPMATADAPNGTASTDASSGLLEAVGRELREPLHALSGLVELLGTAPMPDDSREMVGMVRQQVAHVGALVDDLIDWSRLRAGGLSLAVRPIALGSLVADVVAAGTARAGSDELCVVADIGPRVPTAVLADPARLRQLLDRLMSNAVAFTPRGRISMSVDQIDDGLIEFRVVDTGVGIPDGELADVFEPFRRGSHARATGTGLGLAIVRQLVDRMGGTVTVSSVEHAGTTFTVDVPLPSTDLAPDDLSTIVMLDAPGLAVLVVDDEPVNRLLAVHQLAHLGMRGTAVATAEEAVLLLSKGAGPDLVLMDVMLPGIDGLEATRQIRANEEQHGRRAVIIGITASTLATERLKAQDAGMDDVLGKPVGLATLSQALGRWMHGGLRVPDRRAAVDSAVLDDLVTDLGSEKVVADLVRMYLNEMHRRRFVLAEAADNGDVSTAKAMAHTLKSSSLLLGANEVGHACQRLSQADQPAQLYHLVADVMRTSTAAAGWLQQWLSTPPVSQG
jgi:CheY-like chemotaxis protein/HPt (histidine-containing phosphotransfer) domain-containing protein/anti-sigma regulatory factor (Ser/Thr protein kinase)